MADIFAPKTSFNIGYERPVAQPVEDKRGETQAKFEAMATNIQAAQIRAQTQIERSKLGMANTLLGGIGQFATGYAKTEVKRGENKAKSELFKAFDQAELEREQNNNFAKARTIEKEAVLKYNSLGYDVDRVKTEYEIVFERPFEYVGQSREQQLISSVENTNEFKMALAAASFTKPNASADELRTEALMTVQSLGIAKTKLAMVGAGNQLDWETELKGEYKKIVNSFNLGIIAGFVEKSKKGEPITIQEIRDAMASHDLMRIQIVKPAYVEEEQWNEIKQQLDGQRAFLETIEKSADPDTLIKNYGSALIQAADGDIDKAFAANSALNAEAWVAARGVNVAEELNSLANSEVVKNLFNQKGGIISDLQQADVTTPVNGNTTFTVETAPDALKPYLEMSKEERNRNVEGGLSAIKVLKPNEMQSSDSIKQFYNGVMSLTAGMMTDSDFFTSAKISKIFNNPNLVKSIDMVATVDREAADEMRIALRSAATLQRTALQKNLESIESALAGAVWDEQDKTYYITGDQGKLLNMPNSAISGEMTDKGFKIAATSVTFPEGYNEALDRRKSIPILDRIINDLAIEDEDTAQPSVEEIATTALDQVDSEDLRESSVRSIRNNNPGNIKKTNTQWEGMTQEQADSTFVSFESPEMGVRALARVLNTYNTQYNLDDISGMVSRFAPPTENDTQNYIKFVSEKSGIPRNRKITLQDNPEDMKKVIAAMIEMEGGSDSVKYFTPSIINEGVRLALESTASQDVGIDEDPQQATIERIPVRPDDETLGAAWDILYGNSMKPENKPLRESKSPQQRP